MTDRAARTRRDAIRAEYAVEETEAAEAEVEVEQAVLSVRVPAHLAETLKARAAAEHIPVSVLVRRVLSRSVLEPIQPALTVEQVEEIARRVLSRSVLEPIQPALTVEQVEEIARRVLLETRSG